MRPAALRAVVGLLLGRRGRERAPGSGVSCVGLGRERASADCVAVANVGVCWVSGARAGRCRMATQPSSGLPGMAKWMSWRCCWTAALTWRSRARSAPLAAPPACRPVGVVRGRDAAGCSARSGWSAARAVGPEARTLKRRFWGGCVAGDGFDLLRGRSLRWSVFPWRVCMMGAAGWPHSPHDGWQVRAP